MQHLVDAVRESLQQKNWYAAVAVALTLPDICGKLQQPSAGSQARYVDWCTTYLTPKYTSSDHVFLSGKDAYALRCAVLHEGSDDVVNQRAHEALEKFRLTRPSETGGLNSHNNQYGSLLQLQVPDFCEDICAGVESWLADTAADAAIATKLASMMKIDLDDPSPHVIVEMDWSLD